MGELEEAGALRIDVELLQIEQNKLKTVGIYRGSASPSALHEYFEVDFYEAAPCQLVASFHRTLYKFSFNSDAALDLRSLCEKHWKNNS